MSHPKQLVENMGVDDSEGFRQALRGDDIHVMRIFRDLICDERGQQAVLSLKTNQEDAEGILNLIDRVSRSPAYDFSPAQ